METTERQFIELVRRHRDLIWQVCRSFKLSPAWQPEDAFHEVLCVLWQGYSGFDRRSSERTWIYRVAVNTMITLYRKTANKPVPQPEQLPETSYEDAAFLELAQLIDLLPEPDRTIVTAHAQGYSYAEISQITGLSVGAVGMRLSRALRKLRKQYNQK